MKLTIQAAANKISVAKPTRIILSKPAKSAEYRRCTLELKGEGYHISRYSEKQAFHQNISSGELEGALLDELSRRSYRQINAFTDKDEHIIMINKGYDEATYMIKPLSATAPKQPQQEHNRKKQYILSETEPLPALIDMGVFTKEGRVAAPMRDKFAQINRFLEIVRDALNEDGCLERNDTKPLRIIDFGCGKSYLTFVLYHYLVNILGMSVSMTGLDLKADVIAKCNAAAKRYGYTNLSFERGDIAEYDANAPADMVVTLHACDTATDYALHNAVCRGARMILSVPCCQHELNAQISTDSLKIITRYGIIKERMAALMTDAIRANLLESRGYKTQVLEFVDLSHTPKNLLIRAIKKRPALDGTGRAALDEAKALMNEFSLEPTLYKLLYPYSDN
jgi:SAM-dependent methyltransferase